MGTNGDRSNPPMTPLQAELAEEGIRPDVDPLSGGAVRPDLAPGAGYGEAGVQPIDGPLSRGDGERPDTTYRGPIPVLQWEIDPQDPEVEGRTAQMKLDGWDYSMWWQEHTAGLVYVSIQALRDDEGLNPKARQHPVGSNVVVNLVYDRNRDGIVAIYGTARDFRPFVEAFRLGLGLPGDEPGATDAERGEGETNNE